MKEAFEIMLIEDNEDDYEALHRGLQKNGISNPLNWYNNATDALNYLQTENGENTIVLPSLILLDLNMPGMNGKTFLKKIKKILNN